MQASSMRVVLLPTVLMAFAWWLLRSIEQVFLVHTFHPDYFASSVALLFLGIGVYLAHMLPRAKQKLQVVQSEHKQPVQSNTASLSEELSPRELEVLVLMERGCSNQEIANQLFVSLSTIKTHCSSIYLKLDVKRRTEAVAKARTLQLFS